MPEKPKGLSGNALKLIAAASMLCDHVGLMFFPKIELFRILGRLAFPVFAFMIAEGCRYTRSRLRYFMGVFLLAALCQAVYFIAMGSRDLGILVCFSISILIIYLLQDFKKRLFSKEEPALAKLAWGLAFFAAVGLLYALSRVTVLDYGFWGCMCPVFAALFHPVGEESPAFMQDRSVHVLSMCLPMLFLALQMQWVQPWSFAAVPLLLCYRGRRGSLPLKYFFYIFYPAHLALLQGLRFLMG